MIPLVPLFILDKLTPHKLFARLNIKSKMFLGYLTLVILTVTVVVYALVSIQRLNSLNNSIVMVDVPVQEAAGKMLDALLAQEAYEKRYQILKRKDINNLFWKRSGEFNRWLSALKQLPDQNGLPLGKIERLHSQYNDLFDKETELIRMGDAARANAISNGALKNRLDRLFDAIRTMSDRAKGSQDAKMKRISQIGTSAFLTTVFLFVLSVTFGALAGLVVTHHISSSIRRLSVATERIAEGNFDYDPQITGRDEICSLAEAFRAMGTRLQKLEDMYLDASPLTRLPGGIAIENVLKKRLESGEPLAFCVLDLDNFKVFNDTYGYAHGSEVIKETARIIENAVRANGSADDFVGHVGGDDFVVITIPAKMREVNAEIIEQFDRRIPHFYDRHDRENGYIFGKNRQGVEMRFPLMTISIAIVTNEKRSLSSPLEASEIAAEIKDYAKTIQKSIYVVDKRAA